MSARVLITGTQHANSIRSGPANGQFMIENSINRFRNIKDWERTLYIMFVAQLMSTIGFSSIFPFLPLYVQFLGSNTNLSVEFLSGLVFAVQGMTMMIASPIWGSLADRYGRKLMVQRATFGGAILVGWMGFVGSAEELILLRAIQGLVTGVVSAANALVAAAAPRNRTGYAMGMLQVGLWGGVSVGPLIGGLLADAFGYRSAFVVTGVMLGLAGVLVLFGVHEKPDPERTSQKKNTSLLAAWRHVLVAPGVGLTYGLRFLSNLGRTIPVAIAPLFVLELLANPERVNSVTGLMIGAAGGASTLAAIYLGRLGDQIGHRRVLIGSAIAAVLFYFPQSMVTAAWQLLVLQALTGAAAGGMLPAISALLARYTEPGEEGSVYGLDNSIGAGARAAAPLIGAGVATWYGLRSTFVATAIVFLVIVGLAFWKLPETKVLPQTETP